MTPIGTIHSPFLEQGGTPIQPTAGDALGTVEVDPAYREALKDLEGFDRVWLLFQLHRARPWQPTVAPYRDTEPRGLFATRAPSRPNRIGLSAVRLLAVEGTRLRVQGVDVLDGPPLLDIKPYIPEFDAFPDSQPGWFDATSGDRAHADERFRAP